MDEYKEFYEKVNSERFQKNLALLEKALNKKHKKSTYTQKYLKLKQKEERYLTLKSICLIYSYLNERKVILPQLQEFKHPNNLIMNGKTKKLMKRSDTYDKRK